MKNETLLAERRTRGTRLEDFVQRLFIMNLRDLKMLLAKDEGPSIEFKEAQGGVPASLYETVVSFSNTSGGTIVLGADDDGKVLGIPKASHSAYISDIVTALHSSDNINPVLYLTPETVSHPDGDVIVIRIPNSSSMHNHAGKVYWRNGDSDQDVTKDQQKISDILLAKREQFTENVIYPNLSLDDLDESLFDKARAIIASISSTHPYLTMTNEEILRASTLFIKDFRSGEEGLTLASALVFGKDETIQSLLPAYKVDAVVRKADIDRYDDRLVLRTNLIDTYTQLLAFVKKHLPEKFYQEGGQHKDLRELIFREIVGNVVVHREYTSAKATEFIIYKDKVSVSNPNKAIS